MASTLLGLSCNNGSDLFSTKESSEICRNYYVEVAMGENGLLAEGKKEAKAVRRINKSGEKDTLEEKERRRLVSLVSLVRPKTKDQRQLPSHDT